jgi:hypothetical protein
MLAAFAASLTIGPSTGEIAGGAGDGEVERLGGRLGGYIGGAGSISYI